MLSRLCMRETRERRGKEMDCAAVELARLAHEWLLEASPARINLLVLIRMCSIRDSRVQYSKGW